LRDRGSFSALRWLSLLFVLGAVTLFILQLVQFSRVWANLPNGLTIAGIPVGQLDRQQAAQRLLSAYSLPVELHYNDAVIQISPSVVGFELDLESMLAAADLERTRNPFWNAFWDYMWGSTENRINIPLRVSISEERLRNFLIEEVANRYDRPPTSAVPIPGTINFQSGAEGLSLDIDRSVLLIDAALRSPTNRVVDLPLQRTSPTRPSMQNLEILLKQTIDLADFDGLVGLYLLDLQSAQEIHFLYQQGRDLPTQPDAAFTASSTIKIPIMVSAFRRIGEQAENLPLPEAEIRQLMEDMIVLSGNPPADRLMERVIDQARGPLLVTEDMQALGLENTFLSGYFYTGAPLLVRKQTPANQRTDVLTQPDPYSQTTPSEIGGLLADIYHCAHNGGGALLAVFPGEVTQAECQDMINYLVANHIAVLVQAGVPDGTRVAHKHGWVLDAQFVMHDISDAAIVYTPGGNYVLTIFLYHPVQMIWEPSSALVTDLSRAIYNFYNIP
jgi:beta-lactamase class A